MFFSCRASTQLSLFSFLALPPEEMSNEWKIGLCGCMYDTMATLDVCCCWHCQMSRQLNALDEANPQRDECSCCNCLLASMCPPLCTCLIRRKAAEKFQIEEGCPISCCMAYCCTPCSLCQTHAEATAQGWWPGGSCFQKQPPEANTIGAAAPY